MCLKMPTLLLTQRESLGVIGYHCSLPCLATSNRFSEKLIRERYHFIWCINTFLSSPCPVMQILQGFFFWKYVRNTRLCLLESKGVCVYRCVYSRDLISKPTSVCLKINSLPSHACCSTANVSVTDSCKCH